MPTGSRQDVPSDHLSDRDLLIEVRNDTRWIRESVNDHESRLRSVERERNWIRGAIGIMGTAIGAHFKGWLG